MFSISVFCVHHYIDGLTIAPARPGVRQRPLGKDELIFPPDIAGLSDAKPDIIPELCANCAARGEGWSAL